MFWWSRLTCAQVLGRLLFQAKIYSPGGLPGLPFLCNQYNICFIDVGSFLIGKAYRECEGL